MGKAKNYQEATAGHWDIRQERKEEIRLQRPGFLPSVVAIIFAAGLLSVMVTVLGLMVLIFSERLDQRHLTWFFSGVVVVIWSPAVFLAYREIYNAGRVQVIHHQASPQQIEIIRFVQTRNDTLVPPEDLYFFLEQVHLKRNSGHEYWRGRRMKSGTICNDRYHAQIIQALVEADLWVKGKGERSAGRPKRSLEEARAILFGNQQPSRMA